MSNDTDCTDTSSSTSEEEEEEIKRHKSSKKRKHKSEKKNHSKKKKKKSKRNSKHEHKQQIDKEREVIKSDAIENDGSLFGPALPPHLLQKHQENSTSEQEKKVIGPTIPKEFLVVENVKSNAELSHIEEEEYTGYGPVLPMNDEMTATQIELEQRALELKMAAIEGRNLQPVDTKVREEWMLELPKVGLKGGLDALATMKRTFYQGKERPDFSDRSDWTKTPQDAIDSKSSREKNAKAAAEAQEREALESYVRKRDEEQERLAKSHKKKHKLDESLVEMHRKKLRKEQKKKEKELAKSGSEPERRPFSRDVDLKLNKIDSHQTKQIVDKAKILHSKFSSGHAKYL